MRAVKTFVRPQGPAECELYLFTGKAKGCQCPDQQPLVQEMKCGGALKLHSSN